MEWLLTVGLPGYIYLGMGTLVLVILSEIGAVLIRGPEYTLRMNTEGKSTPPSVGVIILAVLLWPMHVVNMIAAAINKRSFLEEVVESRKERLQQALNQKAEIEKETAQFIGNIKKKLAGKYPISLSVVEKQAPIALHTKEGKTIEVTGRVFLVLGNYGVPGSPNILQRITHTILNTGDIFIIMRSGSSPEQSVHFDACSDHDTALRKCRGDHEWFELCAPGREADQGAILNSDRMLSGSTSIWSSFALVLAAAPTLISFSSVRQ